MDKEHIYLKIQDIESDLELLRNKHVHELEKAPGTPKCTTLADRIQDKLDYIVSAYDEVIGNQEKTADREQFDLLSGMLTRLASEIADLSKKQPDGLVNAFKVGQINRVLKPLKEIMADEPSSAFLDLVAEVEDRAEKTRNSYSDVAVIPEETNRRIVDIVSDVNLAYSEHARRYLADCGLPKERTYVTGSPMAEVLTENLEQIQKSDIHARLGLEKGKYILLSAHREENIDTEKNFTSLFTAINKMALAIREAGNDSKHLVLRLILA